MPIIKKILSLIIAILLFTAIIFHIIAKPADDHPFFTQFDEYPLVIAHAGSKLYPTDTLYALEMYAEMGVDILEMDIHMTKDGQIILIHDDTVDRTTNGTGDVREMTLSEIKDLDAGYYWTDNDGASYPFQDQGITIPTLDEVLTRFPGYPMIIEIKQSDPPMEKELCDLLRLYDMQENVMVPSFNDAVMNEFRRVCPEVATAASESEVRDFVIKNFLMLSGTITPKYYALQVPESRDGIPIVNRFLIWAANHRNIQVHIWTINDPADMDRFIDMDVHGIMTDRTDLLIELLER